MDFLMAFIVGGALCAVFQLLQVLTKLDLGVLLIISLVIGGITSAAGFCNWLSAVGGAGFTVMVFGAADGVFNGVTALFAGSWVPLVTILCIFAALTVLGIAAGIIRTRMEAGSVQDASSTSAGTPVEEA